jgi:nucleosome assembly protein 1-like 1
MGCPNPHPKNGHIRFDQHLILANYLFFRTEIEWYPGKCLTQKVLRKKPKKGSKHTEPIIKTEDCKSFFNFFNPPQVPDDDEEIDEDTVS